MVYRYIENAQSSGFIFKTNGVKEKYGKYCGYGGMAQQKEGLYELQMKIIVCTEKQRSVNANTPCIVGFNAANCVMITVTAGDLMTSSNRPPLTAKNMMPFTTISNDPKYR